MNWKIVWSDFAEKQVAEIYAFYEKKAGARTAKKLVKGIINEPTKLLQTAHIGQEEPLLKNRKIHYRYLLHKKYKIIYSVDKENRFIRVADVFDTRQNPPKIYREKE